MTPEEYAFTVKKRWEAAEKLRQGSYNFSFRDLIFTQGIVLQKLF